MANYDPRYASPVATADTLDAGLRGYMLRVYNYMLVGLGLTGVMAWLTANTPLGGIFYHQVATPNGIFYSGDHGASFVQTGPLPLLALGGRAGLRRREVLSATRMVRTPGCNWLAEGRRMPDFRVQEGACNIYSDCASRLIECTVGKDRSG